MGILKPVMVSTDKGLQLFHSRMVGCHLLSWRNLQKKIAFFRLFSSERSETCDTPKGIYFSELKNLGGVGSGTRRVHMPRAYIFLVVVRLQLLLISFAFSHVKISSININGSFCCTCCALNNLKIATKQFNSAKT